MSKEIKYARILMGNIAIDQVLNSSIQGIPKSCRHSDYETIKSIRWETSKDGKHIDLVVETDYNIISFNKRYVFSWVSTIK